MKCRILFLTGILFLASGSLAQLKATDDKCQGLDEKASALASQYRELRLRRRQLPEGTFDHELNDKLSGVLSALGHELGHPPYTKDIIVGCLGEPDAVRTEKRMGGFLGVYHRELKKAGRKVEERSDREYLIYFWRGWHDFLFFISEDGSIVDHGWWFAYE